MNCVNYVLICEVWQVYDIKIHDLFIDMICKKAAL